MKNRIPNIIVLVLIFSICCCKNNTDILGEVNKNLSEMKTIEYETKYENFNYYTGDLFFADSGKIIFDFTANDTIINANYLIESKNYLYGYDGKTSYYKVLDKKDCINKEVETIDDLYEGLFLFLSVNNLRDLLPQLLMDSSVVFTQMQDSILNNSYCFLYDIEMSNKRIEQKDYKIHTVKNSTYKYLLFIEKETYLPIKFESHYLGNPWWTAEYYNFNLDVDKTKVDFDFKKQSLSYQKYSWQEYQKALRKRNKAKSKKVVNTKAPDWILPSIEGEDIQLSKLNSKLILLEFWFPYCTGCVQSIPHINKLYENYQKDGLDVFSIEYTRKDSTGLKEYITKTKCKYPMLFLGESVADKYDVSSAPTFFLLDNDMTIIYSSVGLKIDELTNAIEDNI